MSPPATPTGSLAVAVNVMLEQWSDGVAPGIGPMGNPLRAGLDHQALSWAGYGPRRGASNLLALFAELGVTATFYTSGLLAQCYPELVRAIADAGHPVEAHGWAQDLVPAGLSEHDEAAAIDRSITAVREATGRAPIEWISPRCTPSAVTPVLLAERGFGYFSDVFDDDRPYVLPTPAGDLVALPFGMEINDLPVVIRYGRQVEALIDNYLASVAARRSTGGLVDVTVHAHISGRPNGIAALRAILDDALADPDVAVVTRVAAAQQSLVAHPGLPSAR